MYISRRRRWEVGDSLPGPSRTARFVGWKERRRRSNPTREEKKNEIYRYCVSVIHTVMVQPTTNVARPRFQGPGVSQADSPRYLLARTFAAYIHSTIYMYCTYGRHSVGRTCILHCIQYNPVQLLNCQQKPLHDNQTHFAKKQNKKNKKNKTDCSRTMFRHFYILYILYDAHNILYCIHTYIHTAVSTAQYYTMYSIALRMHEIETDVKTALRQSRSRTCMYCTYCVQ